MARSFHGAGGVLKNNKMKKQLILEAYNKLESARNLIGRLKRSMLAHPDCTNGSEFDDYTSIAQQIEDELTCFLNEFHNNINGEVDKSN